MQPQDYKRFRGAQWTSRTTSMWCGATRPGSFGPLFALPGDQRGDSVSVANTYLSVASIRVVPPQCVETMVPTNTNMDFSRGA